ncbi:hypothetical protein Tco_0264896 [Tanacetum coccineum]
MLQICPNLPRQKFVTSNQFEEEILAFLRELGYSGNVKSLSKIKVDTLPQPWKTFGIIINKCLSGKVTGLDLLHLVYKIKNRVSKKNKDVYYLRFTKVIINHFMLKDQSILRRNKVDWHMASNDPILTTMRFIPQHEVVQKYGAILPDNLTNQAMKESVAYRTYYAFCIRKKIQTKVCTAIYQGKDKQAPKASPGKRLQATTKCADEGTGVSPGVPDVPTYGSEDEQISWKSSDEDVNDEVSKSKDDDDDADNEDDDGQDDDDQDDENEQTEIRQ